MGRYQEDILIFAIISGLSPIDSSIIHVSVILFHIFLPVWQKVLSIQLVFISFSCLKLPYVVDGGQI